MNHGIDEGRAMQFDAMMKRLAAFQAKYRGVRGELLAKVHAELMSLKPDADGAVAPSPPRPASTRAEPMRDALPSCRLCGRGMRLKKEEGVLVCERGHTRLLT